MEKPANEKEAGERSPQAPNEGNQNTEEEDEVVPVEVPPAEYSRKRAATTA